MLGGRQLLGEGFTMSRKSFALMGGVLVTAIVLVVAAALGAFASGGGATAAGARADAVHVHGNWTIVVRSKSGNVVSRHSFHNEFVHSGAFGGDGALSGILSGQNVAGVWNVSLNGSACPASNGHFCQLYEPGTSPLFYIEPGDTKNLTVTVPTAGADAFKIVLQGHVPAVQDGAIVQVSTGLQLCAAAATAGHECTSGYNEITQRGLAPAISVSAGQDISVTVKLSFS
jgi:hypothetical protein